MKEHYCSKIYLWDKKNKSELYSKLCKVWVLIIILKIKECKIFSSYLLR